MTVKVKLSHLILAILASVLFSILWDALSYQPEIQVEYFETGPSVRASVLYYEGR